MQKNHRTEYYIYFNIEVINSYSNKNFYNYYAVIPRGTISVCQNRIIKKSLLIKALNFTPKKEFKKILIKRFIIPSFIGSFCLNIFLSIFTQTKNLLNKIKFVYFIKPFILFPN